MSCLQESRSNREMGSTTAIALVMLLVLSMVGANVLLNVTTRYNSTFKSMGWQEALWAAEAGADLALTNLRWTVIDGSQEPWAGWKKNVNGSLVNVLNAGDAISILEGNTPIFYNLPPLQQSEPGQGTNQIWGLVAVDAPSATTPAGLKDAKGNQWFRIRSTGYASIPGLRRTGNDLITSANGRNQNSLRKFDLRFDHFISAYGGYDSSGIWRPAGYQAAVSPQATRRIEMLAQPKTPFFNAIIGDVAIKAPGAAGDIDSYDSTDATKSSGGSYVNGNYVSGRYDPNKRQMNGDILSNTADLKVGGTVWGDVGTNGGNIQPSSKIKGQINNSAYVYVPPVPKPKWNVIQMLPTRVTTATTILAGPGTAALNYKMTPVTSDLTIALPPGATTGTVNIWIPGHGSQKELSGTIHVPKGVTCRIFIEGDISVKARDFDNQNYDARFLQIYGLEPENGSRQTINIGSPGEFYAVIYAPRADVKFTGNVDMMGSLIGREISGNGNTSIHFDEALIGWGPVIDYRVASWIEDDR